MTIEEIDAALQVNSEQRDKLRDEGDKLRASRDAIVNEQEADRQLSQMTPGQVDALVRVAALKTKGVAKQV